MWFRKKTRPAAVETPAPALPPADEEPSPDCLTTGEMEIVAKAFNQKEKALPKDSKTRHVEKCVECATRLFNRLYSNLAERRRSA